MFYSIDKKQSQVFLQNSVKYKHKICYFDRKNHKILVGLNHADIFLKMVLTRAVLFENQNFCF